MDPTETVKYCYGQYCSMTTQKELRDAIDWMKADSGSGTKARKQEKFREVYTSKVGHIVTGERYDDAGVGPATARSAVQSVFPDVNIDDHDTISEALIDETGGGCNSLEDLIIDLDGVARRSGNDQTQYLKSVLDKHKEPSLVTLALLDDESIGLGTSEMRGAFFDGTRDERKHREAFVETTTEFINLAMKDELPTGPTIGEPFDPMLAARESRGRPENPVSQKKLDGYRIIIHVLNKGEAAHPAIWAFTRRRNDVAESLPELREIDWPEGEYILDGEVLAENGSYSDTSSRVGRKAENVERDVEMNFHLFDVIVKNGSYLADRPFGERHDYLVQLTVNDILDERVQHVGLSFDIELAKDEAVENDDEGIIIKDYQSPYEFGKRSAYWQKVKMDNETVDVTICGFHEGDGEGTGTLGAVEIETADGVHLGRSGSGFTDAERDEIWENRDEWMGRTIEVEARGIGTNDNLRMPIFIRSREDDGEPDSWERVQEIMKEI